jgi:hypothetical protein
MGVTAHAAFPVRNSVVLLKTRRVAIEVGEVEMRMLDVGGAEVAGSFGRSGVGESAEFHRTLLQVALVTSRTTRLNRIFKLYLVLLAF